jgi:CheY-like chemotaxis protein
VAKILVADDNSNIQKMVGLALKDQGIDVVAVGNGEAAVRKISDVRPDLVLADVFMPVRNGYEVCNYVKQDSALSHIPVILLVGAFDPLDEQEAQRVGADGVLKKPFVPPDPLISMVKSALTRAGVVLGGAAATPPPPPPPVAKAEPPPLPRVAPPPPPPPAPEAESDFGVPSFSSRPPVTIDKGAEPLAFGSLLDTAQEEDPAAFGAPAGGAVAPDRDWGQQAVPEVEVDEESKSSSWRLSSPDDTVRDVPAGQTDWREAAFSGIGAEKPYQKEWAPSVEDHSLAISEEEAAERAKKLQPFSTETAGRGPEDWSKAISEVFPEPPSAPPPASLDTPAGETAEPAAPLAALDLPAAAEAPAPPGVPEPAPEAAPLANSWMAGAVSPWEAELQRASQMASTWESARISPIAVEETSVTEAFLDSGLLTGHAAAENHRDAAPVEAGEPFPAPAKSLLSEVREEVREEIEQSVADQPVGGTPEAPVAAQAEPAPNLANVEEIVAKILAKMSPEVLQAVTREILKPVVEALVKDELNKKQPF